MAALDQVPVVDDAAARRGPSPTRGLLAVVATTGLDAASTLAGLTLVPVLVERNPFARALFAAVGIAAGVAIATAAVVCIVFAVTEGAARSVDDATVAGLHADALVRWIGYGIPSTLSLVVALHNLSLVLAYVGPR